MALSCGRPAPAGTVAETQTNRPTREAANPTPPAEGSVIPSSTGREYADETASGAGHEEDEEDIAVPIDVKGIQPMYPLHGDSSVEEKILGSGVIVRATMTSLSSEVITKADGRFSAVIKFNLSIVEYLKGTGLPGIVAVWMDGYSFGTHAEAEARRVDMLAERDDQWDDREAVIFLYGDIDLELSGLGDSLDSDLQRSDHLLLFAGDRYSGDDFYSLYSRRHRRWLPSSAKSGASGSGSTEENRAYLLDVPDETGGAAGQSSQTPTVTLADLKAKIKDLATEFDGGDGSEAYEECVAAKYMLERETRYNREQDGTDAWGRSPVEHELASGQAANTVLNRWYNEGLSQDQKGRAWVEGADAALFTYVEGKQIPFEDVEGFTFSETLMTVRPLPAGEYTFKAMSVWGLYAACDYAIDLGWTVTVTAPSGTLHEMFFDPVTVGTAVAADASNGVLKPKTFTGASGASATISRIAYEPAVAGSGKSAQVKIGVTPAGALSGQLIDFIGLDGTVSLTLNVASATADSKAGTLTWPVASQPWKAGDKLMVRVRPTPPKPVRPSGLKAASGDGSVTLTWDAASNASITGYEYQTRWAGVAWSAWTAISGSGSTTTSHTVTGLTNGTEYRFKLRAVNVSGAGKPGPGASPWYVSATPQVLPPAAPTGLTALAGNGTVVLTWDDPSDTSITRYEYQMRWTGVGWGSWTAIPGSGSATRSHALTGLTNGTEYRFKLRAVNVSGAGKPGPNAAPWYVSATPVQQ